MVFEESLRLMLIMKRDIRFFIDDEIRFHSATFNRNESGVNEIIDCLPKPDDKKFEGYSNRLE